MKRRIAYLLTVLALCLFCTACGGEEAAPDDPDDGLGGGEPISEDAADAVRWAYAADLLTEKDGKLHVADELTRKELTRMLEDFLDLI